MFILFDPLKFNGSRTATAFPLAAAELCRLLFISNGTIGHKHKKT